MAIVLAMPALSTTLSLVREKEQGTLEGLMAAPIRRYQLLAGKIIPYLLIGLVDILLFTAIGIITFGIPFRAAWRTWSFSPACSCWLTWESGC